MLHWFFFLYQETNRLVHCALRKNSELVTAISFVGTFKIYTGKSQLNLKVSIFVLAKSAVNESQDLIQVFTFNCELNEVF